MVLPGPGPGFPAGERGDPVRGAPTPEGDMNAKWHSGECTPTRRHVDVMKLKLANSQLISMIFFDKIVFFDELFMDLVNLVKRCETSL